MPHSVSRELVIGVPRDALFDVIVDYDRYPEFVPSVRGCRVTRRAGTAIDAEYEVDLGLKRIKYTLRHVEERPSRLTWSLVGGEWMKVSNGSWDLAEEGGSTRARYTVEIQIARPPLVPQSLVDRVTDELTRVQLPRTLDAFKARAEGLGRREPR
jgi:ribosome-associated toxin RatA of RatAB toxin-antitoxin module